MFFQRVCLCTATPILHSMLNGACSDGQARDLTIFLRHSANFPQLRAMLTLAFLLSHPEESIKYRSILGKHFHGGVSSSLLRDAINEIRQPWILPP